MKKHIFVTLRQIIAAHMMAVFIAAFAPPPYLYGETAVVDRLSPPIGERQVLSGVSARITPEAGGVLELGSLRMEIPPHAVDEPTEVSIEVLGCVPALNAGMDNATAPAAGYRALPHGMKFNQYVKISIPYDPAVADTEAKRDKLSAYFYDEGKEAWTRLDRVGLDEDKKVIECVATHFTDFITATVKLPDSPRPLGFNPTSIKDIKAADPSAGVPSPEGLAALQSGAAAFQLKLRLPEGRAALAPQLTLGYNSTGSSGWLGQGFDISIPSISIDISKRLPRFDDTDYYAWAGKRLVPAEETAEGTIFRPQIEEDFATIIRIPVSDPACGHRYRWEVREKNGRTSVFGGTPKSVYGKDSRCDYQWLLSRVEDPNGNYCAYSYSGDSSGHLYPEAIEYTRSESGGDQGYYRVEFRNGTTRPDRRIDMRGGFVNKLDKLLEGVDVKYFNPSTGKFETVRSYAFAYETSAFGKSLLAGYRELDSTGLVFYSYNFEYEKVEMRDGKMLGLADQAAWAGEGSESFTTNSFAGGSLALGADLYYPRAWKPLVGAYAGLNASGGTNETYESGTVLDINADGIPDLITHNMKGKKILLGTAGGAYENPRSEEIPEELWGWLESGSSIQTNQDVGYFGALTVNKKPRVSGAYSKSSSNTSSEWAYADIDGDGKVDILNASKPYYYHNDSDSLTVRFVNMDYGSSPATVAAPVIPDSVLRENHLLDPLRMWVAYRAGDIGVDSAVSVTGVSDDWDGVTVKAYGVRGNDEAEPIGKTIELRARNTSANLEIPDRSVDRGDQLVFRQTSRLMTERDAVDWKTSIHYRTIKLFTDLTNRRYVALPAFWTTSVGADRDMMSSCYTSVSDVAGISTWRRKDTLPPPGPEIAAYFADRGYVVPEKMRLEDYYHFIYAEDAANQAALELIPQGPTSDLWQKSYQYDPIENVMVLTDSAKNSSNIDRLNALSARIRSYADLVPVAGLMPSGVVPSAIDGQSGLVVSDLTRPTAAGTDPQAIGCVSTTAADKNARVFAERIAHLDGRTTDVFLRPYVDGFKKTHVEVRSSGAINATLTDTWIDGKTALTVTAEKNGSAYRLKVTGDWKNTDQARVFYLGYDPSKTLDRETGTDRLIGTLFRSALSADEAAQVRLAMQDYVAVRQKARFDSFLPSDGAYLLWLESLAGNNILTAKAQSLTGLFTASFAKSTDGTRYTLKPGVTDPEVKSRLLWLEVLSGAVSVPGATARYASDDYILDAAGAATPQSRGDFLAANSGLSLNVSASGFNLVTSRLSSYLLLPRAAGEDYLDDSTDPANPAAYSQSAVYAANEALLKPKTDKIAYAAVMAAIEDNKAQFPESAALINRFESSFGAGISGALTLRDGVLPVERSFVFWWELCAGIVVPEYLTADPVLDAFVVNDGNETNLPALFYLPKYDLFSYLSVTENLYCDSEYTFTVRPIPASGTIREYGFPNDRTVLGPVADSVVLSRFDDATGATIEHPVYVHAFDTTADTTDREALSSIPAAYTELIGLPKGSILTNYAGGDYGWFYAEWNGYPAGNEYSIAKIKAQDAVFQENTEEGINNTDDDARRNCQVIWKMARDETAFPGVWHGAMYTCQKTSWDPNAQAMKKTVRQEASIIGGSTVRSFRLGGDEPILTLPEDIEAGGNLSWIRKSGGDNKTVNMSLSVLPGLAYSKGSSQGTYDLSDVNGDRFPDMIKKTGAGLSVFLNKGQCPEADGSGGAPVTFDAAPIVWGGGAIREFDNSGVSISNSIVGGASQVIRTASRPSGRPAGTELEPATTSPSPKISFSDTESLTVGAAYKKSDLIDMNGDGLPDQVSRSGNGLSVHLNDGTGFKDSQYFAMSPAVSAAIVGAVNRRYGSLPINGTIRDAIVGNKPSSLMSFSGNTSVSYSVGAGMPIGLKGGLGLSASTDRSYFDMIDLNGDGLPDLLIRDGDKLKVCFNVGDAFADPVYWGSGTSATVDLRNLSVYKAGDNKSETLDLSRIEEGTKNDIESPLVLSEEISSSTTLGCSYNGSLTVAPEIPVFYWCTLFTTGKITFTVTVGVTIGGGVSVTNLKYGYVDVDGDGLPDNVLETAGGMSVRLNQTGRDGLLKSILLPQGGAIRLKYTPSEKTTDDPVGRYNLTEVVRENWTPESKPLAALPTNTTRSTYEYEGGHYDRNDRSFWGYAGVTTKRMPSASGTEYVTASTDTYLNGNYYLKDKVVRHEVRDSSGALLIEQTGEYSPVPVSTGSVWVRADSILSRVWDSGVSMESGIRYSYDSNDGNPTEIKEYANGRLRNTVDIEYYSPKISDNHLFGGYPEYLYVYDADGKLLRKRYGYYDDNGNLIRQRAYWTNNDYDYLETNLTYFDNGNLKDERDPSGYALEYRYDPIFSAFVTGVTDNLGQSSQWTYDYVLGTELSRTDMNGQTIHKAYDARGRMTAVWSPYDTVKAALEFSYDTASFPWKTVTKNKVNHETSDDKTISAVMLADGSGSILQTKKQTVVMNKVPDVATPGWSVSPWVVVDGLGRERQKGLSGFDGDPDNTGLFPGVIRSSFGGDDLYSENDYDSRDRVTGVTLPGKRADGGKNIQRADYALDYRQDQYEWKITSTDPEGNKRQTFTDVNELILAVVQDPDADKISSTFAYDGIGQMTQVIDDGQHTRTVVSYDALGRRTALDNPESGLVTFVYDDSGDLVQKIDSVLRAKSLSIRYEYDKHRLLREIAPDSQVAYEYGDDPTKYNVGRVIKTTTPDVTTGTAYDKTGEVTSIRRVIKTRQPGQNDYDNTMSYACNFLGQMTKITYPNAETVSYEYDAGGQVSAIKGRFLNHDVVYAGRIGYDEFGQRILLEQGNGTVTTYDYDPARRWLKGLQTVRTSDNEIIQNLTYGFYENGDVKIFTDTSKGKTYEQKYFYDRRDQLKSAEGLFRDTRSALSRKADYRQLYDYDRLGNIREKRSILNRTPAKAEDSELNYANDYKYDNPDKPHQATMVGDTHYMYDANGNLTKLVPGWEWNGGIEPESPHLTVTTASDGHDTGSIALGLRREPISITRRSGTRYLNWDSQNRLSSVSETNMTVDYYYDGEGERRLKVQGTEENAYVDRMYEIDNSSSNPVATINVYLGDTRLVSKLAILTDPDYYTESGNTFYYHADQLGSSSLITDSKAREYERMAFTPHGEVWQQDSLDSLERIDLLFTGKAPDAETGWYYFGARYLDPITGLWLSGDPALGDYIPRAPLTKEDKEANGNLPGMGGVFNPVNLALYHYAGNNPVRYVDPDGMMVIPMPLIYQMTNYSDKMNGSTKAISQWGCWMTFLANVSGIDILTLNKDYVINGIFQTNLFAIDKKLDVVAMSGKKFDFSTYQNDTKKDYSIAAQVPYDKDGDLHWVGVSDVVIGEDGKKYAQIAPTSGKDILSNSWRTDAGWRKSDDGKSIWVPYDKVNEFRVVSKKDE